MMSSQKLQSLFTILVISLLASSCYKTEKADLVVHNAVIYSVDENFTTYAAMAIRDGQIVELGAEREIMNRYDAKEVVDALKRPVYPGFYDAHAHFLGAATNKGELNLFGSKSKEDLIAKVISFAATNQRSWIVGRGWDENLWVDSQFPDKAEIDSLFPDTPVYLMRIDGHSALVNQRALDLADINSETVISDGIIEKNAKGELTGIVIDGASKRVEDKISPLPKSLLYKLIAQTQRECFEAGVTTITDAGLSVNEILFLDSLHKSGDLKVGIYAMLEPGDGAIEFMQKGPFITDQLSARSFKLYADGSLGSRGALLKEPYSDQPETYGVYLLNDSILNMYADACYKNGFQLCTHCIGDSANAVILEKYASTLGGVTDLRWRIEHAQVVSETDRHYYSDYAIIPSMQPVAAISDMNWATERLGEERIKEAYSLKSLKNQLGFLALGTDFPVDQLSPIGNFYSAVFRKNKNGEPKDGYQIDEALSREDALRGITIWAALASFEEGRKGTLEAGKRADFVILDTDLINARESDIAKAKVLATYVAGQKQYPQ